MNTSTLLSRARRAAPEAAPGRAVLTISAVTLAVAGLAACSSSSAPAASSSPPAATTAPASSAAPTPAAAGSSAAASGLNVCSVLTREQVGSLMGEPVFDMVRSNFGATSLCTYSMVHSTIEVEVAPTGSASDYAGFSGLVTSGANPADSAVAVPGLGQQALLSSFGVAVQTPAHAFLVRNVRGQVPNQLAVTLSKTIITALGQA